MSVLTLSNIKKIHANPIFQEAYRELGKILAEKNTTCECNGIKYHSMSEAVIANLLEKYVPNYKIEKGKTWQINGSMSKTIDFLINNEFIEYHPILKFYGKKKKGAFKNYKEYQIYKELKEKSKDKNKFDNFITNLLAAKYMTERLKAIKESEYNYPLTLCISEQDIYNNVIKKYSNVSKEEFITDYNQLKKDIKEYNKNLEETKAQPIVEQIPQAMALA